MDKKLETTIHRIKALASQNQEFDKEMRKMFGKTSPADSFFAPNEISTDVVAIREALEIRANKSFLYDFITNKKLKEQLIIDNLRMENSALNLQLNEDERFYSFCVNAFYQLENVINYYFHTTYPDINDLLTIIEKATENSKYPFKRKYQKSERTVGDIHMVSKINAICDILLPDVAHIKETLSSLRNVRNEGAHRCMVIFKDEDDNQLYKFRKYKSINDVRILLKLVVSSIEDAINNLNKNIKCVATITSMLPSCCYIKYSNETGSFQLDHKFFSKVKSLKSGDKIEIIKRNTQVIDVAIP